MGGRRLAVVYAIRLVKRLPVILFSVIFLTAGYYGFYQTDHDVEVKTDNNNSSKNTKNILIWSTRNHIDLEVLFLPGIFDGCTFDCSLSQERTLSALHQSDAIVFNMPPMKLADFPIDPNRRPEQRYVFFSPEPPMLFEEKEQDKFNNLFNLTMSYRRDSDIIYSYGDLIPSNNAVISTRGKTQKTKLVAWFVSHCLTQSRREAYFERLREYIPVDVYGDCYNNSLKCSYNDTTHLSGDHCYDMVERDYKFYLAFENSVCSDYVTEKFFKILQRRIVPIVLGGADYSKFAPPNSYIDASKYSPRKLAQYLQQLDKDDQLYNEFFKWKKSWSVTARYPTVAKRVICELCAGLHNTTQPASVYDDLGSLWNINTECRKPKFKGLPLVFGLF